MFKPKPKPKPVVKPKPKPKPKPAAGGKGWLLLGSTPWTRITIDGRDTGMTTPKKLPLSAGKHTIRLRNPKFGIDKSFKVVVKADATTKVIKRYPVQ